MEKMRKTAYRILYEDKDITRDISSFVSSISYFDNITGTADEISIELENRDGRWFGNWMPELADRVKLYLGYENNLLFCGRFSIDQKIYRGFPETLSLKGNSYPLRNAKIFLTNKTRVFENTTLKRLVEQIIQENELQPFVRLSEDVPIKRIEQHNISDSKFLQELAKKYDCLLQFLDEKVVFTSWKYLEDIPPNLVVKRKDLISYSIDDNNHTLYKEATVEYFDKEDNKVKTYTFKDPNIKYGETLKLIEKAESLQQAKEIAKSALRSKNMTTAKIRLELMGDTRLVSGLTVNLEGFGNYDGKYLISTARHTINQSGYKTSVELRKCWNY